MFTVRLATLNDYEAVSAIEAEVYALHAENAPEVFLTGPYSIMNETLFTESLQNKNAVILVAEAEQQVVGYAHAIYKDASDKPHRTHKHVLSIAHIGVLETHRGQGIGTKLIAECELWGQEKGCTRVTISAHSFNTKAQELYKKQGFLPDSIKMSKSLSLKVTHNV